MADLVAKYRETLVEALAEQDDALMEKYFAGEELTLDELYRCTKKRNFRQFFVPSIGW